MLSVVLNAIVPFLPAELSLNIQLSFTIMKPFSTRDVLDSRLSVYPLRSIVQVLSSTIGSLSEGSSVADILRISVIEPNGSSNSNASVNSVAYATLSSLNFLIS